MKPLHRLLLATLLGASATAQACGYCVEDTVAAVYDYGLHQRALAQKHEIAFFAWDGPVTRDATLRRRITEVGESLSGVDRGSVRVSLEPAALAVAYDPRKLGAAAIHAALNQRMGSLKLDVRPLQLPQAAPRVGKSGN